MNDFRKKLISLLLVTLMLAAMITGALADDEAGSTDAPEAVPPAEALPPVEEPPAEEEVPFEEPEEEDDFEKLQREFGLRK